MIAMEFRNVRDHPPEQPAADGPPRRPPDPARSEGNGQPDQSVHRPETLTRPPMQPDRQKWLERLERAENHSGARDELKDRLNQLAQGHPSSPWHEDGTPRPPAPKLSDLEQTSPGLSDADYATHVAEVADGLEKARSEGLTTDVMHALGPDHQEWSLERARIHKSILEQKWDDAAEVPCDRQAIIAGGLGGAGKTTVLEKFVQVDRASYLTIDPDEFKKELAGRGLVPEIPGLSPMESSSLAHEESSYLAKQLAMRASSEGKNIIWDITMSSPESASRRVDELRGAGYDKVQGIFVDIPVEVSVARSEARHRRGCDLYLDGQGIGGRLVPPDVIRAQADTEYGSVNRRAFEVLKGRFDQWSVYDNSGDQPVLIENSQDQP
jgi:predicted ABC-type ATPase